jgi:hypothetical protein
MTRKVARSPSLKRGVSLQASRGRLPLTRRADMVDAPNRRPVSSPPSNTTANARATTGRQTVAPDSIAPRLLKGGCRLMARAVLRSG